MVDKVLTDSVYYVPPNAHISSQRASFFVFEDNDAVIKMIIKRREPLHVEYLPNPSCEPGLVV